MKMAAHRRFTDKFFYRLYVALVRPVEERQTGLESEMAFMRSNQVVLREDNETLREDNETLRRQLEALDSHMSYLLDRLGQVNQLDRVNRRRINDLAQDGLRMWSRLEFVRNEFMFELRSATGAAEGVAQTAPIVRNPERLSTTVPLRVNVGCGPVPLPGYVNCDARDLPGVDVVADAGNLPFAPGEVAEIFSAHVLEHFPQEYLRRTLLPYWRTLLAPSGELRAVVPDAEAMLTEYGKREREFTSLRRILFGDQEYAGDSHFTMFSPESMLRLLTETGFIDAEVLAAGRENGECLEMEVRARASE